MSITPPLEVCLDRIQKRNGGKDIDEKAVESKWNTVYRNVEFFSEQGLQSIAVDNSNIQRSETLGWFFDILAEGGHYGS